MQRTCDASTPTCVRVLLQSITLPEDLWHHVVVVHTVHHAPCSTSRSIYTGERSCIGWVAEPCRRERGIGICCCDVVRVRCMRLVRAHITRNKHTQQHRTPAKRSKHQTTATTVTEATPRGNSSEELHGSKRHTERETRRKRCSRRILFVERVRHTSHDGRMFVQLRVMVVVIRRDACATEHLVECVIFPHVMQHQMTIAVF